MFHPFHELRSTDYEIVFGRFSLTESDAARCQQPLK